MIIYFKAIFPEFTRSIPLYFDDFKGNLLEPFFLQKCTDYIYGIQREIFNRVGFETNNRLTFTA
ncbi:hypothetical protein SB758_38255, partial [Burkholderia sp. SIMBA_013]